MEEKNERNLSWQGACLVFLGGLVFAFCLIIGSSIFFISSFMQDFDQILDVEQLSISKEIYQDKFIGKKKVAIIEIHSVITSNKESDFVKKVLEKVYKDEDIIGVVLSLNTPGGEVTATDEIYQIMQKIRQKGKVIVACMHSVAASGGYYLAAGTDYIIANKYTITGSIGVIFNTINVYDLVKRNGIKSVTIKSGAAKDSLHPLQPIDDKSKAIFQSLIDEAYKGFAQVVSKGRNIDYNLFFNKDSLYSSAQVMSAQQAKKLKLIDELGYLENAVEKVKELTNEKEVKVHYYRPTKSFTEFISEIGIRNNKLIDTLSNFSQSLEVGRLYYRAVGLQ